MITFDLFFICILQSIALFPLVCSVFIYFRILRYSDFTMEASYTLAPIIYATSTSFIFSGHSDIISILPQYMLNSIQNNMCLMILMILIIYIISIFAGGICGLITNFISQKCRINPLLSSILVVSIIYSIDLTIMNNASIPLVERANFLIAFDEIRLAIVLVIAALFIIPTLYLLFTEHGLVLRAMCVNPGFAVARGLYRKKYLLFSLFIANALAGISGITMSQIQNYADVNMGVGIAIYGICAMMIGETFCIQKDRILPSNKKLLIMTLSPYLGGLIYSQLQCIVISVGLAPSGLKIFTALLLIAILIIKNRDDKKDWKI